MICLGTDHSLPEGVIWPNEYGRTLDHDRCIQHKVAFLPGLIYYWVHDSSMNSFEGVCLMLLHKCSLVDTETGDWNLSEGRVFCYMRGKASIMGLTCALRRKVVCKCSIIPFCQGCISAIPSTHSQVKKTYNFLWMIPRHQVHLENGSLKINL